MVPSGASDSSDSSGRSDSPGRSESFGRSDPPGTSDPSRTSDPSESSEHVREPQQKRSRKTLERLVDAAREIIEEEGVQGATVSALVERAGSSVGSFYARFDGKDDLLRYLEERVWREALTRWQEARSAEAWEELDLEGVVRTVVRLLVRIHQEDAGSRRALGRDAHGGDIGEEAVRFHALVEGEVAELLLRRRDAIVHPDPDRAVMVAYRWAVGGIRELLGGIGPGTVDAESGGRSEARGGDGRQTALAASDVADEVTRGLVAYLTGGIESPPEDESVEFFDVWQ